MKKLPEIKKLSDSENIVTYSLMISEDIVYFKGHFPDIPILPGVVQTQWAIELAVQHWPLEVSSTALKQIKFKELILPGDEVLLELCIHPEKQQLHYAYQNPRDNQLLSSGVIETVKLNS